MNKIPNSQLIEKDIPSKKATWRKIQPFALTFNGYEHWGTFKKCREVAQQGVTLYKNKRALTLSLTDLRTCLFFEAMRWRHLEKEPTKQGLDYIHVLSEAIRARVLAREIN
jgi:hypothetical protein